MSASDTFNADTGAKCFPILLANQPSDRDSDEKASKEIGIGLYLPKRSQSHRPSTAPRLRPRATPDGQILRLSRVEQTVFKSFCSEGNADMGGNDFVKLCKDCQVFDRHFRPMDADFVFAVVLPKAQYRMDSARFAAALTHVAAKKGVTRSFIQAALAAHCGHTDIGLARLHYDKSIFTGWALPPTKEKSSDSIYAGAHTCPLPPCRNVAAFVAFSPHARKYLTPAPPTAGRLAGSGFRAVKKSRESQNFDDDATTASSGAASRPSSACSTGTVDCELEVTSCQKRMPRTLFEEW